MSLLLKAINSRYPTTSSLSSSETFSSLTSQWHSRAEKSGAFADDLLIHGAMIHLNCNLIIFSSPFSTFQGNAITVSHLVLHPPSDTTPTILLHNTKNHFDAITFRQRKVLGTDDVAQLLLLVKAAHDEGTVCSNEQTVEAREWKLNSLKVIFGQNTLHNRRRMAKLMSRRARRRTLT